MTERQATSDAALVRRVLSGEVDAFEEIVNRYSEKIYGLVAGMIRDRGHAEDVVQEVFHKAFRKLEKFEQKSQFYTWIYRIAVNTSLDHLKSRERAKAQSLDEMPHVDPEVTPQDADPSTPLLEREFVEQMEEALEAIPPKFREILVLREVDGLSYEEIADVLQCSKGTVESRLFRARGRLREKLRHYLSP